MLDREGIVSTKVRELSRTSLIDSKTYFFFSKNLIFMKIKVVTYFYFF